MDAGKFELLPVADVELDPSNPRIRRFLENYEGDPTASQIALALDVAGAADGEDGATSPEKLRNSILSNGTIIQPIIVRREPLGRMVCVEGNTRLFLYRSFVSDGLAGDWTKIPALVHSSISQEEIDAIRLQAHLVGPRPWDAYSKAKYQWELQFKQMMPLERIVALCGGNKRDVTKSIAAYADMEHYYRPICSEEEFDAERYSGFVELQSANVKDAILKAGFTLGDFAKWIKAKNIRNLQDVRKLPAILSNKKARAVFLKKDVPAALEVLGKPDLSSTLKGATIGQLSRALAEKCNTIKLAEVEQLKNEPQGEDAQNILDARDALQNLAKYFTAEN